VICVMGAVPQCLELAPIFADFNAFLLDITPLLSVFIAAASFAIAIGLIIALAITALVAIGNVIRASYEFTRHELGKRKSKDEEEKPKRKNDERHWYQDENGDYVAWSEAADDGEVWYLEIDFYADEEERIE
jgi:hypothetical protein